MPLAKLSSTTSTYTWISWIYIPEYRDVYFSKLPPSPPLSRGYNFWWLGGKIYKIWHQKATFFPILFGTFYPKILRFPLKFIYFPQFGDKKPLKLYNMWAKKRFLKERERKMLFRENTHPCLNILLPGFLVSLGRTWEYDQRNQTTAQTYYPCI